MLRPRQGLFLCGGPCRAKTILITSRGRLPRQGPPSLFRPCRNTRPTLPETHRLLARRPTSPETHRLLASRPTLPETHRLLASRPTSQETSSPSCRSPDLAGNTSPSCPSPDLAGNIFSFLPATRPRRFLLPVHGLLLFLFRGSAQHFPDHIAVQAEGSGQLWNRRLHCPAYVGDQTGLLLQGQS